MLDTSLEIVEEKGREAMTAATVAEKVGVVLAIDSPITRRGAFLIISKQEDMEVVGETGENTFSLAGHVPPKTVLLRAMPVRGNFGVVNQLREVSPEVSIVALAEYEDDEGLFQAVAAGARAFVTKQITGEQLMDVLRRVYNGECLVCRNILNRRGVASRVLERFRELSLLGEGLQPLLAALSPNEEGVMRLIAEGNSVDEISSSTGLGKQAVFNCVASALNKLEANERTQHTITSLMARKQ